MKSVFLSFALKETIPVTDYLTNRKLKKYFNRETSSAMVAMGKLLEEIDVTPSETPVYYATGLLEYEDYGLDLIVEDSVDQNNQFSDQNFIGKGLSRISPLSQFKILQNVPLCFVLFYEHSRVAMRCSVALLLAVVHFC